MFSELITAVKERIDLGHSKANIKAELESAGYGDEAIEQVFNHIEQGTPLETDETTTSFKAEGEAPKVLVLPKTMDLISMGFNFAFKRIDLILWLALPFSLVSILDYLSTSTYETSYDLFQVSSGIFGLFSLILYVLTAGAVLFIVTKENQEVTFTEGLEWAKKNVWGFVWVTLLTMSLVMGGFLFFFIPGVVVLISTYLAQYVFAVEGLKGMAALRRSRQIVSQNWFAVAAKLTSIFFIILIIFLAVGMFFGFIFGLAGSEKLPDLLVEIGGNFFSAIGTLISSIIGITIYRSLVVSAPAPEEKTDATKWQYWLLIVLGPVLLLIMVAAMMAASPQGLNPENWSEEINVDHSDEIRMDAKNRALELRLDDEI